MPKREPKERPIIFSVEMVQRILSGDKSQTRRVISTQPDPTATEGYWITSSSSRREAGRYQFTQGSWRDGVAVGPAIRCPHGEPGDLLWVREGWRLQGWDWDDMNVLVQYKDLAKHWRDTAPDEIDAERWMYWLIDQSERILSLPGVVCSEDEERCEWPDDIVPWKTPIFMPRWATRLVLEIQTERVQRLQEISEEDAKAEGVGTALRAQLYGMSDLDAVPLDGVLVPSYRNAFATLWDRINGHRAGCRWADNPWIFVTRFAKVEAQG